MKKNIDVIFIANLNHALPRVPSLAQHLSNLGLLVVILTPEIGQKKLDEIKKHMALHSKYLNTLAKKISGMGREKFYQTSSE